ncbi:MAG: hypothetical protein IH948_08740 [Bacteroidetes bacterium]|nr:hypothetical protein [Bacteroidota bacterium]
MPYVALAGDGPGGVGDDDGASILVLWLDADLGHSCTDNVVCGAWTDQSGYGNNAATSGSAPKYQSNDADINSNGYMEFKDDGMAITEAVSLNPDDLCIFLALEDVDDMGSAADGGIICKTTDATYEDGYGIYVSNITGITVNAYVDDNEDNVCTATIAENTPVILCFNYDKDEGGTTELEFYEDNAAPSTDDYSTAITDVAVDMLIGKSHAGGTDFTSNIAEIIMYNRDLNDAERIIVSNYLSAKFAIALTSNDIYTEDDSGYDFEMIGIGQAASGENHTDSETDRLRIYGADDLGNGEYFMAAHDNGGTTSSASDVNTSEFDGRMEREWGCSEVGEVGTLDIRFDLSHLGNTITTSDLRLIIDTDGDGLFNDELESNSVSGATSIGGGIYEFTDVPAATLNDGDRFTIGLIAASTTSCFYTGPGCPVAKVEPTYSGDLTYSGPGGVGDINGTSSMVMWLNAEDLKEGNYIDGENVDTWWDRSGYNNDGTTDAYDYAGLNAPLYDNSEHNGRPSVYFDADNHEILEVDNVASMKPTTAMTVFGMYQPEACGNTCKWGAVMMIEDDDTWDADGYCFLCINGQGTDAYFFAESWMNGVQPAASPDFTDGTLYAIAMRADDTNDVEVYSNDGNVTASSGLGTGTITYDEALDIAIGGYTVTPVTN